MRHARRQGITLVEILISILIFGVGVVSILTLFPLGMMRVREATRYSRSGTLTESATADLLTRNLLHSQSFQNNTTGVWYYNSTFTPWPYNPWVQDTPAYMADPIKGPTTFGAYRGHGSFNIHNLSPHDKAPPFDPIYGPGLPVAYDPLWRNTTPPDPSMTAPTVGYYLGSPSEARFGSGIGFVRPDPNGGASSDASAHGLQRITNFPASYFAVVPEIFVSPDDVVLQSDTDSSKGAGNVSPIAPDLSSGSLLNDWKYTWMFTGQQADATNATVFTGDIVIFENRPFAIEPAATAFASNAGSPYFSHTAPVTGVVAGETVVEAIFGYTSNVTPTGSAIGYGTKANRAVLLRWSATMPDPEVKVGNWIADVTYERNAAEDFKRMYTDAKPAAGFYPYQRCYWYQVAKRTQPGPAANAFTGDAAAGMREMTVWVSTPLRAYTLIASGTGEPFHVNAALLSPYVVNVFPRTIYTR